MKTSRPKKFSECTLSEKIGRVIYVTLLIVLGAIGMWSPFIYMNLNYPDKLTNCSITFGIILWCVGFMIAVAVCSAGVFSTLFIYKKIFRIVKEK